MGTQAHLLFKAERIKGGTKGITFLGMQKVEDQPAKQGIEVEEFRALALLVMKHSEMLSQIIEEMRTPWWRKLLNKIKGLWR